MRESRRSYRMRGYDYSLAGAYFVTIVTYQRKCLFGEIVNGAMVLNHIGKIALDQWNRLGKRFQPSDFSAFMVMPNHIHGIINLVRGAGVASRRVLVESIPLRPYSTHNVTPGSLGAIVRAYKASVTYRINIMLGSSMAPIWQRNYYDHIIRDEEEYEKIWNYIETNPIKWMDDLLYSQQIRSIKMVKFLKSP